MNENIKELIKQATVFEYDELFNLERDRFDKEKFAELIVRECADWVKSRTMSGELRDELKRHFGVEK
jgi:hypothetical protein